MNSFSLTSTLTTLSILLLLVAASMALPSVEATDASLAHLPQGVRDVLAVKRQSHTHTFNSIRDELVSEMRRVTRDDTPCVVETHMVTQRVDHFNILDRRTYKQRVHINKQFYQEGGPVFVYIGGEGPEENTTACSGFWYERAQDHNALMIVVEHRFYGKSVVFPLLTTENLRFLTTELALADLVGVVGYVQREYKLQNTPFVSFGGSYPGSLSAYFRTKYPNLVAGATASSAPVEPDITFTQYEEIGRAGATVYYPQCMTNYNASLEAALDLLKTQEGRVQFQQLFNPCVDITGPDYEQAVGSLMYLNFPSIGGLMQYYITTIPSRQVGIKVFCAAFNAVSAVSKDPLHALKNFFRLSLHYQDGCLVNNFTETYAGNMDLDAYNEANYRTWFWQKCSMYAYFRTYPGTGDNPQFYRQLCNATFGHDVFADEDYWISYLGGGWNSAGTNIFWNNGKLDGWHGLSVQPGPNNNYQQSYLIANASHCEDMYGSVVEPNEDMKQAHAQNSAAITQWLQQWRQNRATHPFRPDDDDSD